MADFSYSGSVQTYKIPKTAEYVIECWGSQGGGTEGGKGGYVKGKISLSSGTTLSIYVGGTNGYNGGGAAGIDNTDSYNGGSQTSIRRYPGYVGGGATDIRMNGTSLSNRIIVAGAGGGAGGKSGAGGNAGENGSGDVDSMGGRGATVSQYGMGGIRYSPSTSSSNDGYYCQPSGGGGGGGYYGGGGGAAGYVYGYSTKFYQYSGYDGALGSGGKGGENELLTYIPYAYWNRAGGGGGGGSNYISSSFNTTTNKLGSETFPSPSGANETGHSGNGYVRITEYVPPTPPVRIKVNNTWKSSTVYYIKVSGAWKLATTVYVKVNGVWKLAT